MKSYRWKRAVGRRVKCARGSIRSKEVGKGKRRRILRICCPAGKWSAYSKRCKVGTRLYEIGTPK